MPSGVQTPTRAVGRENGCHLDSRAITFDRAVVFMHGLRHRGGNVGLLETFCGRASGLSFQKERRGPRAIFQSGLTWPDLQLAGVAPPSARAVVLIAYRQALHASPACIAICTLQKAWENWSTRRNEPPAVPECIGACASTLQAR